MPIDTRSFRQKLEVYSKVKAGVIAEVSRVALKFFRERFRRSAWQDTSVNPWKKTIDLEGEKPKRKRGILIKSGALLRSIRVKEQRANMLTIATDRPYAKIHNEGGHIKQTVTVRKHTRRRYVKKVVQYTDAKGNSKNKKKKEAMFSEVSSHSRKMNLTITERRFIGNSRLLNRYISLAIYSHFKRNLS